MGRLRILSGQQLCRILEKQGFTEVRRRGSHIIMQCKREGTTVTVPVPNHGEIKIGTMLGIIRQSGVPRREFEE